MVDIGINIANNLKAKNFLGTLSIRNGLFFIAIQQFLLGISLYSIIHYLHPSMMKLAWLLFGVNAISAILGFFGALKRNMIIECVYLVFYFISLFIVLLTVLDMAELVHLLPKAPQLHHGTNLSAIKAATILRAGHVRPHVFIKQRDMPMEFADDILGPDMEHDLELESDDMGGHHVVDSSVSTDVEDMPSLYPQTPGTPAMRPVAKKTNMPIGKQVPQGTVIEPVQGQMGSVEAVKDNAGYIGGIDDDTAKNASSVDAMHAQNTRAVEYPKEVRNSESSPKKGATEQESSVELQPSNKDGTENGDNSSFYDNIPLVPHFGEREGEAEEVSKDELPPETRDLSPEAVSEVVAMYKIQKRPLKMAAAGLITMSLLFNIYCYWVAVTFVLNKCTCLDELVSHPEQFTPLID